MQLKITCFNRALCIVNLSPIVLEDDGTEVLIEHYVLLMTI